MKTKSILLASALLMSASAFAQKNTFKGVVLDDQGEPVIGATIQVKGQKGAGAITDMDGNFIIDTDAKSTLVITYIGFKETEVKPSANMRITLKQDDKTLDEVVVVGYGVQKKSVVTAAIAKVGSEDLAGKSPVRVDNALKGLAAGVNVPHHLVSQVHHLRCASVVLVPSIIATLSTSWMVCLLRVVWTI